MTNAVMTQAHAPQIQPDTNGLGHSRDAWRTMTAAKLSKRQTQVLEAVQAMARDGTTRVHYLDVWFFLTGQGIDIMPQTVCSRIGELITAKRLREVVGVSDTNGRKGRIVELVARQASFAGMGS